MTTTTITDTDRLVLRKDGRLEIQDSDGNTKCILEKWCEEPNEIVAAAREAQLNVLTEAVYRLAEKLTIADDHIKTVATEAAAHLEKAVEQEGLAAVGKNLIQSLRQEKQDLLSRAVEAEALLEKMKTAISEAQLCWKHTKSLRHPKIKDLQRELTEIHRLLSKLDLESDPLPK